MQVDVSDMKGESVVRAGSKQDPKKRRSNPVPIWISKCSSIVESDLSFSPVFFSLLSQVLKTGQGIGFFYEYLSSGR